MSSLLVPYGHMWPGARTNPKRILEPVRVRRPDHFFREDGPCPEQVTIRITKLPAFAHLDNAAYTKMVVHAVNEREAELRARAKANRKTFLGREAILAQSPYDFPTTRAKHRKLSPRIKCADPESRIKALTRLKVWYAAYVHARDRTAAGEKDVTFPHGTYWMRLHAGVKCAAPD